MVFRKTCKRIGLMFVCFISSNTPISSNILEGWIGHLNSRELIRRKIPATCLAWRRRGETLLAFPPASLHSPCLTDLDLTMALCAEDPLWPIISIQGSRRQIPTCFLMSLETKEGNEDLMEYFLCIGVCAKNIPWATLFNPYNSPTR